MYGGMNRNELRGLLALIVLIAAAVGAQAYLRARMEGNMWVEVSPSSSRTPRVSPSPKSPLETTGNETSPDPKPGGPVDLNSATLKELETLPKIGKKKALAIVEYRERTGGFRKADELLNIEGIGEKTWLRLKPLVRAAYTPDARTTGTVIGPAPEPPEPPILPPTPSPPADPPGENVSISPVPHPAGENQHGLERGTQRLVERRSGQSGGDRRVPQTERALQEPSGPPQGPGHRAQDPRRNRARIDLEP